MALGLKKIPGFFSKVMARLWPGISYGQPYTGTVTYPSPTEAWMQLGPGQSPFLLGYNADGSTTYQNGCVQAAHDLFAQTVGPDTQGSCHGFQGSDGGNRKMIFVVSVP